MKIVLAIDTEHYSEAAVRDAARLAINTWAEVTVLAVTDPKENEPSPALAAMLRRCRDLFLEEGSPYGSAAGDTLAPAGDGRWQLAMHSDGRKPLRVLARRGPVAATILDQVASDAADLLVLGAAPAGEREWYGELRLPQRLAASAPCAVLVVKESKPVDTVVCLLDSDAVSQESLELINQMVTIHGATLKIVGVSGKKGVRNEVERAMAAVQRYYSARGITALVRFVGEDELAAFAADSSHRGLVGLWYRGESLFKRLFSRDRLEQLVAEADFSVLVLQ